MSNKLPYRPPRHQQWTSLQNRFPVWSWCMMIQMTLIFLLHHQNSSFFDFILMSLTSGVSVLRLPSRAPRDGGAADLVLFEEMKYLQWKWVPHAQVAHVSFGQITNSIFPRCRNLLPGQIMFIVLFIVLRGHILRSALSDWFHASFHGWWHHWILKVTLRFICILTYVHIVSASFLPVAYKWFVLPFSAREG